MNKVFIATSIDGFIADKKGNIDWLQSVPNPDNNDMGYGEFMSKVDAIIMGRNTFEIVCSFGIDWPYDKPVYVLSNSLKSVPDQLNEKVVLVNGALTDILDNIRAEGHEHLYIDGGKTIQSFLTEDLIDEMIITIIPRLLGEGIPLFTNNKHTLGFKGVSTKIYLNQIIQNRFVRSR